MSNLVKGKGGKANPVDISSGSFTVAQLESRLDKTEAAFYTACQAADDPIYSNGVSPSSIDVKPGFSSKQSN